jgi:hypothetical protein
MIAFYDQGQEQWLSHGNTLIAEIATTRVHNTWLAVTIKRRSLWVSWTSCSVQQKSIPR